MIRRLLFLALASFAVACVRTGNAFTGHTNSISASSNATAARVEQGFPQITKVGNPAIHELGVYPLDWYALTPDGSGLYDSRGERVDVITGTVLTPSAKNYPLLTNSLEISPSGRYLTAAKSYISDESRFLFDLQRQTYTEYAGSGRLAISWSHDSSRILLSDWRTLLEVPSLRVVKNWMPATSIYNVKHASGYDQVLWDSDNNTPIAIATYCPIRNENSKILSLACGMQPISLTQNQTGFDESRFTPLLTTAPQDTVIDALFDPTGNYVLFIAWERSRVADKEHDYDASLVIDSVFYLVNWRTGTQTEWLRLSSVEKDHAVVSRTNPVQWSSDGSTILIPRVGAEPLILKVRYP